MKELNGHAFSATDGEIGRCTDLLFDDRRWVIRYLVADTGKWIRKRRVLIEPQFLGDPEWPAERVEVQLTRKQIANSPALGDHEPVSARKEAAIAAFYGVGAAWLPGGDPRLRSLDEVEGYQVRTTDDDIGRVEDLIADDRDWSVHYLVVDTRNWLPGKRVLVSPKRLQHFDWSEGVAKIDVTRAQLENSPVYDPARPVRRAHDARLGPGRRGGHRP